VKFVAPEGYTFTTLHAGTDTTKDSDGATTGLSQSVTLEVGQSNITIDAGLIVKPTCGCTNNLVLNPSFELNTGTPPMYWTNGTAGPINVPAKEGNNVGYITGTGVMYQCDPITVGKSYTFTFYSGSHNPYKQTVSIQYYDTNKNAIGSAAVYTIVNDLEVVGFGANPATLTLGTAPSNAVYIRISVSANGYDFAKVDALCLHAN
jgi:hypothetical protein